MKRDIPLISRALSQAQVQQASLSVMKMAMGIAERQGDAVQKLLHSADVANMQHAAPSHLGGSIDVKL